MPLRGIRRGLWSQGLDDYLSKPIESNELLFILKKFLKQKPKDGEETELELKVDEDDDIIDLMLDDEPLERKILLFKKNPLETQILAKVLINIGYEVDVVSSMDELEGKISDRSYDILL